ncbi:MAG: PilZ domain-containing protein [Sandaracinus sp.]|nr:PilZ domain-containing protein [Sandaracinus sp.]MCB9622827.1 PilZ domain-containing protein [Sandaracinus sp.]
MQEAIERRNPERTRVPLEDVLVELRPEGFDEAFEADAVDLGLGGLAMRAAILPDVGSRLHCRFQSPHDGRCVDASAEVVWARDDGASAGEFGLRFDTLDPDDEASIRGFVEAWQSAMGLDMASDHGVVSLKLEGVGPRLDADVVHRSADVLVVEQGLPFLRLGKGVEEDGRLGRLESVDLRVDGETPRLVLTIGFDRDDVSIDEGVDDAIESAGDTLMDVAAPAEPVRAKARPEAPRVEEAPRIVVPDEAEVVAEPDAAVDDANDDVEAEAIVRAEARRARRAKREAEAPQLVRSSEREVAEDDAPDAKAQALAKARTLGVQVKAWVALVGAKVVPACRAAWARSRHAFGSFARRVGPFARVVAARFRGKTATPATKKAAAAPARAARAPRRSTAVPGRESRVDESAPSRTPRKWIVLGALAAIGTGSAVALAGGDEAPAPTETTTAEADVPVPADPESGDTGAVTAPEPGGPMAAPSFPSLRDGARPNAAPGEVPTSSPYAVDVNAAAAPAAAPAAGSATFGTEGTSGDELRMRMDGQVGGLRGERTDDGFRVVVPGVRAIDGARRLAAMNPAIERASILNESEGAVLSVRFVAGQTPAYFVRAEGDGLVVTVAR